MNTFGFGLEGWMKRISTSFSFDQSASFSLVISSLLSQRIAAGLSISFFVLVAVELLAADSGIAFLIQEARWQFQIDRMTYGAILIGIIGYILFGGLSWRERRLLVWKPKREQDDT